MCFKHILTYILCVYKTSNSIYFSKNFCINPTISLGAAPSDSRLTQEVQAFGVAAAAFLYLVIAAAGAAQSWGCSMRHAAGVADISD